MPSPTFSAFLRALIPSWTFFNRIGDTPELRLRSINARGEVKSWQLHPAFRNRGTPKRGLAQLFHNPEGNGRLSERSLVFRALEELSRLGEVDFARSETHQQLVELAARGLPVDLPQLQFQIWVKLRDGSSFEAYLSEILETPQIDRGAL